LTYYVHINKQAVSWNRTSKHDVPCVIVREGKRGKPRYCRGCELPGPSRVVQSDVALPAGARVWMETEVEPVLDGEMSWEELTVMRKSEPAQSERYFEGGGYSMCQCREPVVTVGDGGPVCTACGLPGRS